jgi:hypothetical protein
MSRARDYTLQFNSKILSRSVSNITNAAHEENGQSLFFSFHHEKIEPIFFACKNPNVSLIDSVHGEMAP